MKKVFNVLRTIFVTALYVFTVVVMIFTIISVTTFDRNDRSLFGYKIFIVLSDSMSATDFDAGDIVLVKEVDPSEFAVGDIICYTSVDPNNFGETVTHKIRAIDIDANGNRSFTTYGTTTGVDDAYAVADAYVKGKYVTSIPKVGTVFNFLKTTPGYIICILVPFLILILSQAINSIKLFRQYKKEQSATIEAERAQLAAEREESQKMMEELLALKAQLAAMKDSNDSDSSDE